MVVEFFEVVVGGFRWLQVVPSFSNTGLGLVTPVVIHVDLPLKAQSFFKGSEFSMSEV